MRTKKATINVIVNIISLVITTVMGFILSKVFLHKMGVEIIGLNSIYLNVMAILSISELGIAGAINYNLYKPILENDYKKISSIMYFYKKCYRVIGIFILAISLILSFFIHYLIKDATLSYNFITITFIIYSLNTISTYFLAYIRNLYYGFQQVYIPTFIDFMCKFIKTIIQIILIYKYKSYIVYLVVNVLFDFMANFIIYKIGLKKYNKINFKDKTIDKYLEKKVFNDVKSLSIIQLTNAMINFTDTIIISKFVGIIETGLYANYKLITTQLNNVVNSIFNGIGASIGNLLAENNINKIKKNLIYLEYFCFILSIICFNGLMIFTQPFISVFFGKKYLLSKIVVILLSFLFYININRQVITYFLRTGGYHERMKKTAIMEAGLNLVISMALVFRYGIIGVLIGTIISSLYAFFANSVLLYKIYDFNYINYIFMQIRFLVLSILFYIVFYYFMTTVTSMKVLLIWLVIFAITLLMYIVIIICHEKELKELIRILKSKYVSNKK